MKTLSQALENTLSIVKKTDNSLAESQYSLIKSGGSAIMERLSTETPEQNTDSLIQYLKNTLKLPVDTESRIVYTDNGCDFIPDIKFGALTVEQKAQAKQVIDMYFKPLPSVEIVKLIARLQIISPEKEKSAIDREARTAIWVEELSKYPADVVSKALKQRYRWFPSLAEVLDYCDSEVRYRDLIRQKLKWSKV